MKAWSYDQQRYMTLSLDDGVPFPSWSHVGPMWVLPALITAFTLWAAGMRRWVHWRQ